MRKKVSLLLIGMLLLAGCSKKETVTAEELLGNPYGAAVESGDFDIEVAVVSGEEEYSIKGSVQFDKSAMHFKGAQSGKDLESEREYYIVKSNNGVKRYNYTPSTGRWGEESEDSLDTSGFLTPAALSESSLTDLVVTGKTTVDKLGSLGVCPVCWVQNCGVELPGSTQLSAEYTFDKDTKRLRSMKFFITEPQPGSLNSYTFTVAVKSFNNITVSVPKDIVANAVKGSAGSPIAGDKEYYGKPIQPLPDEYKGYVLVETTDPLVEIAKELELDIVEYNGVYLMDVPNYNKAYAENAERQGLTVITNPEEDPNHETGEESSASSEPTEKAEETTAASGSGETTESGAVGGSQEPESKPAVSDMSVGALKDADWDTKSEFYKEKWPGILGSLDEGGVDLYVSDLNTCLENPDYVLSTYVYWNVASDSTKMVCAMAIDLGIFTKEQCVAAGAASGDIDSCMARLK